MQIGVTRSQIEECLSNIEVVEGMDDLFGFITANGGEIVVISASFMANVECGLEGAGAEFNCLTEKPVELTSHWLMAVNLESTTCVNGQVMVGVLRHIFRV